MKLAKTLLLSLALSSAVVHAVKGIDTKGSIIEDAVEDTSSTLASLQGNVSDTFKIDEIKSMFSAEPTGVEDAKARLAAMHAVFNLELQDYVIRSGIMTPQDCIVEALEFLAKIAQNPENSESGEAFDAVFSFWHDNQRSDISLRGYNDETQEHFDTGFNTVKGLVNNIGNDTTHPRYQKVRMLRVSQLFQYYTTEYVEAKRDPSDILALRNMAQDVAHPDAYFAAHFLSTKDAYKDEAFACLQILMNSENPNADLADYVFNTKFFKTEFFKAVMQLHEAKALCEKLTVENSLAVIGGKMRTPDMRLIEALDMLKVIALDSTDPKTEKALEEIFQFWNANQTTETYDAQFGTFINASKKALADLIREFSGDESHPNYEFVERLKLIPALN